MTGRGPDRGPNHGTDQRAGRGVGRLQLGIALISGAGCVGPGWGNGRAIANTALFLASDEARLITGARIVADGGMAVRGGGP